MFNAFRSRRLTDDERIIVKENLRTEHDVPGDLADRYLVKCRIVRGTPLCVVSREIAELIKGGE